MVEEPKPTSTDRGEPIASMGWLLFFVFSLVFIQGLMINHLSVLLPVLKDAFNMDDAALGVTGTFAMSGYLGAFVISGYVTERIGARLSGVFAMLVIGAGTILTGSADTVAAVRVSLLIVGFGLSWVLAVHSSVVTTFFSQWRQRMFLLLMATLAAGAIVGPPLLGRGLDKAGTANWGSVYITAGLILWAMMAAILLIGRGHFAPLGMNQRKSAGDDPGDDVADSSADDLYTRILRIIGSGVFNRSALYLIGLIVILDNLASMNILLWIGVLAKDRFEATAEVTGDLMATMAVGTLFGRIILGAFISGRISDRKLLGISYGLAMVMFMFMLGAPSLKLLFVLYFIMSMFMSAQSATTYAIGAEKFKDRAAAGIPLADGIGSIGALAAPWMMGLLASRIGLAKALWLVPIFGFALMFLSIGWELIEKMLPPPQTLSDGEPTDLQKDA